MPTVPYVPDMQGMPSTAAAAAPSVPPKGLPARWGGHLGHRHFSRALSVEPDARGGDGCRCQPHPDLRLRAGPAQQLWCGAGSGRGMMPAGLLDTHQVTAAAPAASQWRTPSSGACPTDPGTCSSRPRQTPTCQACSTPRNTSAHTSLGGNSAHDVVGRCTASGRDSHCLTAGSCVRRNPAAAPLCPCPAQATLALLRVWIVVQAGAG